MNLSTKILIALVVVFAVLSFISISQWRAAANEKARLQNNIIALTSDPSRVQAISEKEYKKMLSKNDSLEKILSKCCGFCHIEKCNLTHAYKPQMIQTKAGAFCKNWDSKIFLFHVSLDDTHKCYA